MPDRRRHRGAHPEDRQLFSTELHARLRSAVADLSWLLGRGYAEVAARKLVGDRHELDARQRIAVQRAACSDAARDRRSAGRLAASAIGGRRLWIDGFNVLITVESALAGAALLRCRDGCLRDMASLHGTYRVVAETDPASNALIDGLAELAPAECRILLDRPVSNSGRVRALLIELGTRRGLALDVELHPEVDATLRAAPSDVVVATADSGILARCGAWFDLASWITARCANPRWEIPLADHVPPDS